MLDNFSRLQHEGHRNYEIVSFHIYFEQEWVNFLLRNVVFVFKYTMRSLDVCVSDYNPCFRAPDVVSVF